MAASHALIPRNANDDTTWKTAEGIVKHTKTTKISLWSTYRLSKRFIHSKPHSYSKHDSLAAFVSTILDKKTAFLYERTWSLDLRFSIVHKTSFTNYDQRNTEKFASKRGLTYQWLGHPPQRYHLQVSCFAPLWAMGTQNFDSVGRMRGGRPHVRIQNLYVADDRWYK